MPPRKRVRRRKRRNATSLSSSSSSSTGSPSDDEQPSTFVESSTQNAPLVDSDTNSSDTDSSTSDISSKAAKASPVHASKQRSSVPPRSPSPVDVSIPPMFPPSSSSDGPSEKEKALKEKFKKFWMSSIADAFKDELEEIRKEPNLTTSRLSLLIDALASGADVYASNDDPAVNEIEMVLGDSAFEER